MANVPTAHWTECDWDKLTLGKVTMPGVWQVEGECKRRLDHKKTKGSDGAALTDQGYEPGELNLNGQITDKKDWQELLVALKDIHPRRKGKSREPLALVHPASSALGVDTVYVIAIEIPKLENGGVLHVRIRVLEWIPAPKPIKNKFGPTVPKTWSAEQRAANAKVGGFALVNVPIGGIGPNRVVPTNQAGDPVYNSGSYVSAATPPVPPAAAAPMFIDENEVRGWLRSGS